MRAQKHVMAAGYHMAKAHLAGKRFRRGGAIPLAALAGVHEALKTARPFSKAEDFLTSTGIKAKLDNRFGASPFYQGLKKIGNFLTGSLGYGRRHRRRHVGGYRIIPIHKRRSVRKVKRYY